MRCDVCGGELVPMILSSFCPACDKRAARGKADNYSGVDRTPPATAKYWVAWYADRRPFPDPHLFVHVFRDRSQFLGPAVHVLHAIEAEPLKVENRTVIDREGSAQVYALRIKYLD